jgi:hypothetical protein
MGQAGLNFTALYAEHINDIKQNKDKSKYAKYRLTVLAALVWNQGGNYGSNKVH